MHELAKECGVESRWVLARFKELGEFVKSASSTISTEAEARFRTEFGDRLASGESPESVGATFATREYKRGPRPRGRRRRRGGRVGTKARSRRLTLRCGASVV
ncbi:hypothetical protein NPS01_21170 [Nocardioides psychrotolerans]|nr:hypothetical protein NPS01_21170 [Nocardioides psychrotolerans]